MRYLFASFMLALLLSAGISLPAAAQSDWPVRERSAERWSEGIRFTERSARSHRHRAAHTRSYREYSEEAAPRRRHSAQRYAKRRHARVAKHMRRHQRTARRPGITRRAAAPHQQTPAKKQVAAASLAAAPQAAIPDLGRKSLGSDGRKAGGMHGVASYYWEPQALASGGRFNPNALTAAHKTLPFGTRVRVTHLGNGRSVEVKINDRGPYVAGRIIDLSKAAASIIGMTGQGVARVAVEVLGR
jgi:rare lipoprotein A